MQLLFHPDKSKITAPFIQCKHLILVILLLLLCIHIDHITAERICHQCNGINCLRTSYVSAQKCLNDFDICVTIFDRQTVLAKGCLEQISEEIRYKCDENDNDIQNEYSEELNECFKCNDDLCNKLGSNTFECIQCDSNIDKNCRTNSLSLLPSRCDISRSPNEYCFVRQEGQRVTRGCLYSLEEQESCITSADCMICQPSELWGCNGGELTTDDSGSGSGSGEENTGGGDTESDPGTTAKLLCHQCNGINCLRTSYEASQKCFNDFDICVTVFDGQTILAQGCFEQLSEELRNKCENNNDTPDEFSNQLIECVKCNENLCNNLASNSFECLQCDSDIDENCRINPLSLLPLRCGLSRTPNEYCFIRQEGERVTRGCTKTLEEQKSCLSSLDCMICQPSELGVCNGNEINYDSSSGSASNDSGNGSNDSGSDGETGNVPGDGDGSGSGSNGETDGGANDDTGNGGSGSGSNGGSGDGNTGDGNLENGGNNNSGNGSSDEGSNSGSGGGNSESGESGDGSNGVGSSIINYYILIVNILVVFFANK